MKSAAQKSILTLTLNPSVDKTTSVEALVPEAKLRCEAPKRYAGGGGINSSRTIRCLGGDSTALYTAGGPTGQILIHLVEKEGFNHIPISIQEWTRDNLIVLERSTRRQYRFGMPGPHVSDKEWKEVLGRLSGFPEKPEYVIVSGSLPPGVPDDFVARVAAMAKARGARVIVDTSGEPLRLALQKGVYLIKPNLRELRELMKLPIQDDAAIESAMAKLLENRGGVCRIKVPKVSVVSTVGAGDSMTGAMVLALARGMSVEEAGIFGVAAGTATVMSCGAEICHRENFEELYRQILKEHKAQRAPSFP